MSLTNAGLTSAANHIYGLIFAVGPGNCHGLRSAAGVKNCRRSRWLRRASKKTRRISMCPIPGNIIFVCVVEITRYRADRLRKLYVGHSIGWSPEERPGVREEIPSIANDAMMHRAIDRWMDIRMDIRMYRSGNSSPHRPGLAERLVGSNGKRHADRH